jgi:succinate dehydrogenase / fumarate reductase cytochrome b subunit
MDSGRAKYLLRRLHSLSGILPLAVFMAEHYYTNAHALGGAQSFNDAVNRLHEMPYLWALEFAVVLAPLLFHSVYGLFITADANPNNADYQHLDNLAYTAQRVTGVFLALFVVFHVYETRLQDLLYQWGLGGAKVDYNYMAQYFTPGWIKAIYIVGVGSLAFHLGNGLFNFAFKWGIAVSEKAQRGMRWVSWGTTVLLFAIGVNILFAFK